MVWAFGAKKLERFQNFLLWVISLSRNQSNHAGSNRENYYSKATFLSCWNQASLDSISVESVN